MRGDLNALQITNIPLCCSFLTSGISVLLACFLQDKDDQDSWTPSISSSVLYPSYHLILRKPSLWNINYPIFREGATCQGSHWSNAKAWVHHNQPSPYHTEFTFVLPRWYGSQGNRDPVFHVELWARWEVQRKDTRRFCLSCSSVFCHPPKGKPVFAAGQSCLPC